MSVILAIKDVCKSFNNTKSNVLEKISFDLEKGKIYGLIGASGSGKSTLLRCISAIEKPSSGIIESKCKKTAVVFQNFSLLSRRTALENVMLPLELASDEGLSDKDIVLKAMEALDMVGIANKANFYPSQLSGGQKQSVAIAGAIVYDADLLLCDECTSALDSNSTRVILELLKKLNTERGMTIIIVTHEVEVIKKICSHTVIIEGGKVLDFDLTETLVDKYADYFAGI